MTSEKEIALRDWEMLDDEQVVRSAATKGKFIHSCIRFLSERRGISILDARKYFYDTVLEYVERLINNRQIHKADHVLKNVKALSKNVYFQISKESSDPDLREYLVEYYKKNFEDFENDLMILEEEWFLFHELKVFKDFLLEHFSENIHLSELDLIYFDNFCRIDRTLKDQLITFIFFKKEAVQLVPHLNKYKVWDYLIENNMLKDIKLWSNGTCQETQFTDLRGMFRSIYQSWSVDHSMFRELQERLMFTESILYGCAGSGCFLPNEADDIQKVLNRIVTMQAIDKNDRLLNSQGYQNLLLNFVISRRMPSLLSSGIFTKEFLSMMSQEQNPFQNEIKAILNIERLFDENLTREGMLDVSRALTEYATPENSECPNRDLSELFEGILSNRSVDEIRPLLPDHFQHMRVFFDEAFAPQFDVDLNYLIKRYLNIDLRYVAQNTFDTETGCLPSFENTQFRNFDVYPHKLSYLHYIKQGRSSYAAYLFLIEQLRQYSKISSTHLLIAAQNVVELAMTHITDPALTAHCVAFIENLGVDSMKVRALVRCVREIEKVDQNEITGAFNINQIIETMFEKVLVEDNVDALNLEAVGLIASAKSSTIFKDGICDLLSKQKSWFKCLLLCQYLNLPTDQVHRIISMIPNVNLRNNLMLAVQYDKAEQIGRRNSRHFRRRRRTFNKQKSEQTNGKSILNLTHILNNSDPSAIDLMGVILQVTDNIRLSTFIDFLDHILNPTPYNLSFISLAWAKKWAVFALMAAVKYDDVDQNYLWLLWLMISTGYDGVNLYADLGFNELAAEVIAHAIKNGFTETFSICTKVFYTNSAFCFFAQFLEMSKKDCRNLEAIDLLKKYLMVLHSDNLSPISFGQRADALAFSAKMILYHIEHNFVTSFDRLCLLTQLCPLGHFDKYVDFELMRDIYKIIDGTGILVPADVFTKEVDQDYVRSVFREVCDQLKEQKLYEKAIKLAKIFDLSINQIMFEIWRRQYESGEKALSADVCENDVKKHELNPEILVEFYLSTAAPLEYDNSSKYYWMMSALQVMQRYNLISTDSFEFDQLESRLVVAYVKNENYTDLKLYHSHFHQTVMTHENFVIYQTLTELRTVACVGELTATSDQLTEEEEARFDDLIDQLLDHGDIVQALRYQVMFNRTPHDLRYVILCMDLAEGSTSVYRIPVEERKALNSDRFGASRLNRRTLLVSRFSQSSITSSPRQASFIDTSNTSPDDFEEIPNREMQDTKEILSNICGKVKHGIPICQRILWIYRVAMLMEQPYEGILKRKDPFSLLSDVVSGYCLNKILVISDVISAAKMTPEEVADFLSHQLSESIIKARFYLLQNTSGTIKDKLWDFDLDTEFHLFLELCPNTTLFGSYLLCYFEALNIYRQPNIYTERKNPRLNLVITNIQCILQDKILSQKKQNMIQIELLIKAHQCFLHECSVEGISEVLQKAKALVNVLSNAKSWSLIIRLLTGIGRYKEMFYCFDILVINEQFTQLIKKCSEERSHSLQSAIMSYIREQCSSNKHYFESAAAHFCMYKELAELYSNDADTIISTILASNMKKICIHPRNEKESVMVSYINGTKAALTSLQTAMDYYSSSTELFLLDNKLSLAQSMVSKAEVVALQICLINQGHSKYGSICVLKPDKDPKLVTYLVNHVLSVPQSIILLRGADITSEWSKAIFEQFVMRNDEKYLIDFLDRLAFTESMLDDIYKMYNLETRKTSDMYNAMQKLISYHHCSADKYKLNKV